MHYSEADGCEGPVEVSREGTDGVVEIPDGEGALITYLRDGVTVNIANRDAPDTSFALCTGPGDELETEEIPPGEEHTFGSGVTVKHLK